MMLTVNSRDRTPNGCVLVDDPHYEEVWVGQVVNIMDEQGRTGGALVTAKEDNMIFLSVAWGTLTLMPRPVGRHRRPPDPE